MECNFLIMQKTRGSCNALVFFTNQLSFSLFFFYKSFSSFRIGEELVFKTRDVKM